MSVLKLIACAIVLCCVAVSRAQTSQPTTSLSADLQRGEFHISFTERNPLSTPKEIAHRFASKIGADYDLSADKFAIYVPKDYDSATPCGLIVVLCYKHSEETAPTLHDLFDKNHLIFAVTEQVPATPAERVGTSLDAVYNLSKLYKIDPNRIWVLGEPPAQELAMGFPDVFTAGIYRQETYFRPIQSLQANSGMYKALMARPLPEYIARSKAHRHVHLMFPNPDEYHQLVLKAFAQDGFKDTLAIDVDSEAYHYPNFTTDWFEKVVSFLDAPPTPAMTAAAAHHPATRPAAAMAAPAAVPPGTPAASPTASAENTTPAAEKSASAPPPNAAQNMLNLAKSYISAKAYTPARKRLNTIIAQFPDDPAAVEAKQLLQTLPPQ